ATEIHFGIKTILINGNLAGLQDLTTSSLQTVSDSTTKMNRLTANRSLNILRSSHITLSQLVILRNASLLTKRRKLNNLTATLSIRIAESGFSIKGAVFRNLDTAFGIGFQSDSGTGNIFYRQHVRELILLTLTVGSTNTSSNRKLIRRTVISNQLH